MPANTRDTLVCALAELGLSDLNARPYDCAFELLAAPPARKRLIMVGFNGSAADRHETNLGAVQAGFETPDFCNVEHGLAGAWGPRTLARRLVDLPQALGFEWRDTVYTNSLLLCSRDAKSVEAAARASTLGSLAELTHRSMAFFEQVTVPLCAPELIIAYSNGLASPSAARTLWQTFGEGQALDFVDESAYHMTYGFTARIAGQRIPVVGVRHLSRFKCRPENIRRAWERQVV